MSPFGEVTAIEFYRARITTRDYNNDGRCCDKNEREVGTPGQVDRDIITEYEYSDRAIVYKRLRANGISAPGSPRGLIYISVCVGVYAYMNRVCVLSAM